MSTGSRTNSSSPYPFSIKHILGTVAHTDVGHLSKTVSSVHLVVYAPKETGDKWLTQVNPHVEYRSRQWLLILSHGESRNHCKDKTKGSNTIAKIELRSAVRGG